MYWNPKLYTTPGSPKLFVYAGLNEVAWRFGGNLHWQPVRRLVGKIYVNDGASFLDKPEMFTRLEEQHES